MAAAESWYDQADMAILTQDYSSPGAHTPTQSLYATCVFGFSCSLDFPKNTSYQHRKQ